MAPFWCIIFKYSRWHEEESNQKNEVNAVKNHELKPTILYAIIKIFYSKLWMNYGQ